MANCNHGPLHAPIMGNTPVGICTKQHVEVAVIHSYHPILRAISTLLPSRYHIPFCPSVIALFLSSILCPIMSTAAGGSWRLEGGSPTAVPWNSSLVYQYYLCPAVLISLSSLLVYRSSSVIWSSSPVVHHHLSFIIQLWFIICRSAIICHVCSLPLLLSAVPATHQTKRKSTGCAFSSVVWLPHITCSSALLLLA